MTTTTRSPLRCHAPRERHTRPWRRVLIGCVALCATVTSAARAQDAAAGQQTRTLLAVFAHPDDETMVGPLLARYAREPRTRVMLAIVTNGDKGVTPFARIPAGEPLAAARAKETECACAALGIQPPILLGFPDAGLASNEVLVRATAALRKVLTDVRPDAIVTWGPDGGYGHPDHRLVSALVTQLVQAGETTPLLYYAGLPKSRLESEALRSLTFPAPFAPTVDEALNTRVAYSPQDADRARSSLACHKSQFTLESVEMISALTRQVHQGQMHLRLWSGGAPRSDLFKR